LEDEDDGVNLKPRPVVAAEDGSASIEPWTPPNAPARALRREKQAESHDGDGDEPKDEGDVPQTQWDGECVVEIYLTCVYQHSG
jgi:hypothetical protein